MYQGPAMSHRSTGDYPTRGQAATSTRQPQKGNCNNFKANDNDTTLHDEERSDDRTCPSSIPNGGAIEPPPDTSHDTDAASIDSFLVTALIEAADTAEEQQFLTSQIPQIAMRARAAWNAQIPPATSAAEHSDTRHQANHTATSASSPPRAPEVESRLQAAYEALEHIDNDQDAQHLVEHLWDSIDKDTAAQPLSVAAAEAIQTAEVINARAGTSIEDRRRAIRYATVVLRR